MFVGENVRRLVRWVLREWDGDYMQMHDVIVTPMGIEHLVTRGPEAETPLGLNPKHRQYRIK